MIDLSVVIVNWNVCGLLRSCLYSLGYPADNKSSSAPTSSLNMETIVVDSASSDGSVHMVEDEFPQIVLIASGENLGYARGNNLGLARAKGRYMLILNPDTSVGEGALQAMLDHLEQHPQVAAVGPRLVYGDGSHQSSGRRFPTLATAFWESTLLHQWFPNNPVARRYLMSDDGLAEAGDAQPVDWLVGAALMIRRECWEQVGGLDEGFFMYFEELDWCRRCRDLGWEIHYLPGPQIVHYEGKSSEQVAAARAIRFQRSKIRYYHKYFGPFWACLVRAFLLLNFALQLTEETLKWLIGHRRALRRERMSAYWQVLKSGLAP